MKNLFEAATVQDVTGRIALLTPDKKALWGKMNVAQMLAHCAIGVETALGVQKPPRVLIGRILGPIIKPLALRNDEPMQKNSPTAPVYLVTGERDFPTEKTRLTGMLEHFDGYGPAACTDHPHAFFGRLTPEQWAILMYKHVDHHLRQFGV